MEVPNIPKNSLTEEIKELICLCEQLAPEYGEDASWFLAPMSTNEITKWENENKISIPKSYKEWLLFSKEAQIRNWLARFYEPDKFVLSSNDLPEDLVVIADLMGDGEQLCFSRKTGEFIWIDHCELEKMKDFKEVLNEIIRMLKPKSCLSAKMEALLISMANASKDKNNGEN